MTTLVHGEENTQSVQLASQALFGRGELRDLNEQTLAAALTEAAVDGKVAEATDESTIVDLLVESGLCDSRGAARRAVNEGGAAVNNEKVSDLEWTPSDADYLHGRWLVLRRGKKNFMRRASSRGLTGNRQRADR